MSILKLGGSCLRTAADYAAIPARARAEGTRVVVLSATSGVTDELVGLTDAAAAGRATPCEPLAERQRALLAGLSGGTELTALLAELEARLTRITGGASDAWERDAVLGLGERLSLVIAAAHARAAGVAVRTHVAREAGVITTPEPGQARVLALGTELARARLAADVPGLDLVAGYVGQTLDGRWTTLGRGGSDVTAVFLGAALATPVLLLKDASGVLTADPLLVPAARTIRRLTPLHALELARSGSGVVAPVALELALEREVSLVVRPWHGDDVGTRIEAGAGGGRGLAWGRQPGDRVRVTLVGNGATGLVGSVEHRLRSLGAGAMEPLPEGLAVSLPAAYLGQALARLEPLCDPGR